MPVFKLFMKILKAKWASSLVYVVVFVALSVFISSHDEAEKSFETTSLTIAFEDEDDSAESRALRELLAKNNTVEEAPSDNDKLVNDLYWERTDFAVTVKKGYAEALAAGDTDDLFETKYVRESYSVHYMENLLNEYVSYIKAYSEGGKSLPEAVEAAGANVAAEPNVTIVDDNDGDAFVYSYFRYLPYILISATMNALTPVLLIMNGKDVRYRSNCSCMKPSAYAIQTLMGSAGYVAFQWAALVGVGIALSGGISGDQWLLLCNSFAFALVAAAIAVLVSCFDVSANAVSFITQILGLGMSFLCGIFVPLNLMDDGVQTVSKFLPAYWYVKANNYIKTSGDADKVAACIAIELCFAAALAVFSALARRARYGKSAVLVKSAA